MVTSDTPEHPLANAPAAASAKCDTSALERNKALGIKHKMTGTPTLVFEDGKRVPGALNAAQLEQQLMASRRP